MQASANNIEFELNSSFWKVFLKMFVIVKIRDITLYLSKDKGCLNNIGLRSYPKNLMPVMRPKGRQG